MADTLLYGGRVASAARSDKSTAYETVRVPYLIAVPLMYLIGFYVQMKKMLFRQLGVAVTTNCAIVDGISINSRRMKEGAARWPSLNTCYNFTKGEGPTAVHRAVDGWWMRIRNAQAVRNRLKIAKRELKLAIVSMARPGKPVRILSLAAGTAQGVIEVAAECNKLGIGTEILLIDRDVSALRYAQELAGTLGVQIETKDGDVLFFTRYTDGFKADIVEMMGLIDYLTDGLVVAVAKKIRGYLPVGGYFFTCHIHPNHEAYFLKYVVDWRMLYRSRDELKDLVIKGGFENPTLFTEPLNIHSIAAAKKN